VRLPFKKEAAKDLASYTKINFGCGYDKKDGFLNVDVDAACNPDLLIKNDDYSVIPQNHFEEIYAKDVLEHISRADTLSALLDWASYLKPGGKLMVETTNILGVAKQLQSHPKFADQYGWTICLYGNQVHPGDFHHTGFTKTTLTVQLLAAGFKIDSIREVDDWLFYIDCHKVSDWTKVLHDNRNKSDKAFTTAIFKSAFGRKPDADGQTHILEGLRTNSLSREQAVKHLFSSPERLFYTAKQNKL
jgi:hypothetical protein